MDAERLVMEELMFVFQGFRTCRCGLDGRVETPGNISNPAVKHSNGEDSVKAKIARGHAKRAGLVSVDIRPAFLHFIITLTGLRI